MEKQSRECGMMCITGIQGVGKTYQNMHTIKDYIKDKFYNKVKGRKVLIFDTNGEYTEEEFAKADIKLAPKRLSLRDVSAFGRSNLNEVRRIDASGVGLAEKKEAVEYIIRHFRNGMLCLEDINTYILNMSHMAAVVGGLVNLRHRGVDVLISYQSARPVEPRVWQNSRWVRMHYQADNVNDIKGKLPNLALYKIAQILVNNRYFNDDQRFFVYIFNFQNKIEGQFTLDEFKVAVNQYLNTNKKLVKEHQDMHNISSDEAMEKTTDSYVKQYYGNA
jgi:hypothetical protein